MRLPPYQYFSWRLAVLDLASPYCRERRPHALPPLQNHSHRERRRGPCDDEGEPLEGERFHVEDRRLTHSVERIELEEAINSLPPGYRIMFVLHDIEGFEHSEIAAILGCTPGNTKSQLFKARRRLRELLIDLEEQSADHYEEKVAA